MKVLVTGANGMLGTHVVMTLLTNNYQVKALVRDRSSSYRIEHENLSVVIGDICDYNSIKKHSSYCSCIIHCAAYTSQSATDNDLFYKTNVIGTEIILKVTREEKISKLIYIGTANTFKAGSLKHPGTERIKTTINEFNSNYINSKVLAQQLVDRSVDLNITTLSPSFMIGHYQNLRSSGQLLHYIKNNKILFYPPGGKNFVNVCDVAKAVVLSIEIGKNGDNLLVVNENLTYRDFYKKVLQENHQKALLIKIPKLIMKLIGLLGDLLSFMRIGSVISRANTRQLTLFNYYSNKKVKNALNLQFKPIEIGIKKGLE